MQGKGQKSEPYKRGNRSGEAGEDKTYEPYPRERELAGRKKTRKYWGDYGKGEMIKIDIKTLTQDAWKMYSGLIDAGFTQGHAMGLISQFLCHSYMQQKLQEEAEFKKIIKEI